MALIHDQQAVLAVEGIVLGKIAQRLDHCEINHARPSTREAADLADVGTGYTEEGGDLHPPLLHKRFPVHQNERGHAPLCRNGAGHYRFPCPWGSHKDSVIVVEKRTDGSLLDRRQRARERECLFGRMWAEVLDRQFAASGRHGDAHLLEHTSRQHQRAGVLLIAPDESRGAIGGEAEFLPFIEDRVVERG
ncbi:MAG: hypothetical protein EWM73_03718 [Nitrospira sp.]|nr:MAG: hypothetical protein EWM73_03718 [Nitrospira sp.]